ncbi:MAG: sigma 54-interacting transcriptional regulator [Desulfatibacillaceae bacterium]|nr:sigma 54-interacting transcriptional regulator [Desulfatibacillaceae bacterium]
MIGRELNRYWETVVNTISDGIMIVNTSGAIVSVNAAMERITGYSREELVGCKCTMLNCAACEQTLASGGEHWCGLFRFGSITQKKCQIQRKDGAYRNVLKNAAILKDDDGVVIGAVGTLADLEEITKRETQLEAFRKQLRSEDSFHGIIGNSPAMRQVFDLIENAARSDAPVIIYGESGTGKELVSRAIHDLGERKEKPFVKVNCASLTESLLESELFGHVRGAYTGAYKDRLGRFEMADTGSIFLDEIGELPLSTQVKLLRVLEDKVVERVGASQPISTDVRIVSATNRDLAQLVESGSFRKDFYFRINVIPIVLPPLRSRVEDIPLLAEAFFRKMRLKSGKNIEGISRETMDMLINHDWPGNVRELKSAFEYAFVTCSGPMVEPHHMPAAISAPQKPASAQPKRKHSMDLKEIEKQELLEALEQANGNQSKAAELLGVSRVTVWNRMKRHKIDSKIKIEVQG